MTVISITHLRMTKTSSQLIVSGEPFLMLSAELHNSTLSLAKYMADDKVWQNMRAMHISTLLGSVSWEQIEPVEGQFDFSNLDAISLSTYVPAWVKKDVKRFPRVHALEAVGKQRTLELLDSFCKAAQTADAGAFAKLMAHLKEFDGQNRTRSLTDKKFHEPIPKELVKHLQSNSAGLHPELQRRYNVSAAKAGEISWTELFGVDDIINVNEMFVADAYSRYTNHVASAGKAKYPIHLYANVWLNFDNRTDLDLTDIPVVVGGGEKAGIYSSGGPCPHMMDVYTFNAPSLDFIAPDLYFHDYETICQNYRHGGQPLLIPEQRCDEKGARWIWSVYANYLALGRSPFEAQANRPEDMMCFFFDDFVDGQKISEKPRTKTMDGFHVIIERAFVFGKPGPGAGMVIHQGDRRFLCAGWGFNLSYKSANPKSTFTGILRAEEKGVNPETCKLSTLKIVGGDETKGGEFLIMPNDDPDYGDFPIAVTISARTCIVECWAYSLEESEDDF
ncbi:hypothetical protein G6011_04912 [Alternaria panax]|uniref:Uncharacterized protein n=1 Tax=Alternaria panax TaxID=48097 RepID=A0AAD4IHE3_9PLEO|nr:hypothetical protein G6011_04912 [Alternaria panax]